jgi:hypothetical protein
MALIEQVFIGLNEILMYGNTLFKTCWMLCFCNRQTGYY